MKKYLSVLLILAMTSSLSIAQSFNLKWVNSFQNASCNDVAVDASGNCYVLGAFSDTVDFDPGVNVMSLVSDTIYSTFLAKYDVNGNYIFANLLPGYADNIDLDDNGNIWVSGRFEYTADFDPDVGTQTMTAYNNPNRFINQDQYVAKYDNNGGYQFAFALVDTSYSMSIEDLAIDKNGNAYVTGRFRETVDFDPSSSSTTLTANSFNGDVFVSKYSASGSLLYAHHLPSNNTSSGHDAYKLGIDNDNNLYVCGRFLGDIDLDPSAASNTVSAIAGIDGFVAKYDSDGSFIYGGGFNGVCRAMDVEPDGDFYIGGTMPDSMDVDFGVGTTMLYSTNNFDIWLAHYDKNGNFTSAKAFESNGIYHTHDFYVNPKQEIIMTGYIRDTVDFDPGNTGGEFISNGNRDAFAVKFDSSCDFQRGMSIGGSSVDRVSAINGNTSGDFWICGPFRDSVDFDPSANANWQNSGTSTGGFLARYDDSDVVNSIIASRKELLDIDIHAYEKIIYVDFSKLTSVDAEVDIYNLTGQLILRKQYQKNNQLLIPIHTTGSQVYLVTVRNGGAVRVAKVML